MTLKYLSSDPTRKALKDPEGQDQGRFQLQEATEATGTNRTQTIQLFQTNRTWWRICFSHLAGRSVFSVKPGSDLLYRSEYVGQATCGTPEVTLHRLPAATQQPAHPKGFSDRLLRLSSYTPAHLNAHGWASVPKCSLFPTSPASLVLPLSYIVFGMEGKGNSGFQRQ